MQIQVQLEVSKVVEDLSRKEGFKVVHHRRDPMLLKDGKVLAVWIE